MVHSVCSRFLTVLGVRHTPLFTDRRFKNSPYAGTLEGLADLLDEYDVATDIQRFTDKSAITSLHAPFVAMLLGNPVIVTAIAPDGVDFIADDKPKHLDIATFTRRWNGRALTATPGPESGEPHFEHHRRVMIFDIIRRWGIAVSIAVIAIWLSIANGLWHNVGLMLASAFNIIGIYICYMLLGKQLHISSATADAVCGFLQKNGCGSIMSRNVSKIFGLIGWGEVGMAYFTVSLIALIVYPGCAMYLALFNACCLPYTVWSISYQKFVAHTWCTLCCIVQTLQWLLFGSYLIADAWHGLWPLHASLFILGFGYLLALLVIDRLMPVIADARRAASLTGRYDTLRLHTQVFDFEQSTQPQTAPPAGASTIIFGNTQADDAHTVTAYIDLMANNAPGMVRDLDAVTKKGYKVQLLFHLPADTQPQPAPKDFNSPTAPTPSEIAARSIIALYLRDGEEAARKALGEFLDTPKRNPAQYFSAMQPDPSSPTTPDPSSPKTFAPSSPTTLDISSAAVDAEIARQQQWLSASTIFAAPTIAVADRLLADIYHVTDLIYLTA